MKNVNLDEEDFSTYGTTKAPAQNTRSFEVNPIYFDLLKEEKKFIILKGGMRSGKTYFAVQKVLVRVMFESIGKHKHRFLIIKKVGAQIRDFIFKDFIDLIAEYDLQPFFQINQSNGNFKITYLPNGNSIIFKNLEEHKNIRGIKGLTGILVDEADQLDESDMLQLIGRLSEPSPYYKQILVCFNPTSDQSFLKSMFFDEEDDDIIAMTTTLHDNLFLEPEYVKDVMKRYANNKYFYDVYIMGMWGSLTTEGALMKDFEYSKHVKKDVRYYENMPLHISYDFNTLPGSTIVIAQIHKKVIESYDDDLEERYSYEVHIIDELQKGRTRDVSRLFKEKYNDHHAGLFIYGDPSGKKEDTRNEKGYNDYTEIETELFNFNPEIRLVGKAPSVIQSVAWVNLIFEQQHQNITIIISEKCKKLIDDFVYLKVNDEGGKFIQKAKDKETGRTYERYGHFVDGARYLLTTYFTRQWNNYRFGIFDSDHIVPYRFGKSKISASKRWI